MTKRAAAIVIAIAIAACCGACRSKSDGGTAPAVPAATVSHRVVESELTSVQLTPEAVQRLGVKTTPIELREMPRPQTYPGEIMLPPEQVVIVSAPAAGVVTLPKEQAAAVQAGDRVAIGDPVLLLMSGASTEGEFLAASDRISRARARSDATSARVEAQGQVSGAHVQVDAAKLKFERAETLHRGGAGSQRALDEARAEYELTQAALSAATERLKALDQVLSELDSGNSTMIPIRSPLAGQIRSVQVAPGQTIPAGALLFEVVDTDPVWVRVPIYEPELARLSTDESVFVRGLADRPGANLYAASRVNPPANSDPQSVTRNLYYTVANGDGRFQPGQRVAVVFSSRERGPVPVTPRSAVVIDVDGGTWVYVQTAANTFSRRRVSVRDIVGEVAMLERGPAPGTPVVTQGAAELFGTEFGAGK